MLPKRRRLSAYGVRGVLKRGRSARGTHMSAKFTKTKGVMRAAVVVPKSVAPRAVERNQLRRALYQALSVLPASASADVVFFVQKIPSPPLARVFMDDAALLLNKISHTHV